VKQPFSISITYKHFCLKGKFIFEDALFPIWTPYLLLPGEPGGVLPAKHE
jgi:hypothetical protein